jgi:hypothetical protein
MASNYRSELRTLGVFRMAVHRVICVNTETTPNGTHRHIAHLGLGNEGGWYQRITVAEAVAQLHNPWGDRYYTISPTTGQRAEVIEAGCEVCNQRPYVRTTADGVHDNNLLALTFCAVA